jgi:putative FmdB family regulatory protein
MPTYGYECLSCDNQFEVFQSIKNDALTICETCGGTLRKRIYPVGISFKGSGFYVNDYAPKPSGGAESSAPAAASEGATPASGGEAKSEAKSEAKPEAKSEPVKTETKTEAKAPAAAVS